MEERMVKKTPRINKRKSISNYGVTNYHCPNCNAKLFSVKNGSACGSRPRCCPYCGQALSWVGVKIETYWPCE